MSVASQPNDYEPLNDDDDVDARLTTIEGSVIQTRDQRWIVMKIMTLWRRRL